MGGLTNWSVSIRVDILECPLGFYEDQGVCKCVPLLVTSNVHCNVSLDPRLSRIGNSWFAYLNDSQCITGVNNCPFDYCSNQSNISFDLTTPDHQCVDDRTGILCGQCHSGLSLMLGSMQPLRLMLKLSSVTTTDVCNCWYSVGSHTDVPQLDCICGNYQWTAVLC